MRRIALTSLTGAGLWLAVPEPSAHASGCDVHGVVRDAAGGTLAGIEVRLEQGTTVRTTATDRDGRYRFVAAAETPMHVAVVMADGAHDPAWFRLTYDNAAIEIRSDTFSGDADCE
ncbi:MAG: carboxypeptidase regulatory-like domain-containing protein, partial [Myxococcota bacterium]